MVTESELAANCLIEHRAALDIRTLSGDSVLYVVAERNHLAVARLILSSGGPLVDSSGNTDLHIAVLRNNLAVVTALIESGLPVDVRSKDGLTPLMCALDEKMAQLLHSKGATLDAKCSNGNTGLHIAAAENKPNALLEFLISQGISVHIKGECNRVPLMLVTSVSTAQFLLSKGADIKAVDKEGNCVLHLAAMRGNKAVVEFFLSRGIPVDIKGSQGRTAFMLAHDQSTAEFLLSKGAAIDAKDEHGNTALHSASECGHDEIINFLLSKNMPVDALGHKGQTPLMMATTVKAAEFLLSKQASIEAKDTDGNSVLYAAASKQHIEVMEFFLSKHIIPRDEAGNTDLHKAVSKHHELVIQVLLDAGMDIDIRNKYGVTPLMCVVHEDIARILLGRKASIDAKDGKGNTALHAAAAQGLDAIVDLLLKNGAIVDVPNECGCTALMYAVTHVTTSILLKKGANIWSTDVLGNNALHLAAERGHVEVAKVLIMNYLDLMLLNKAGNTALHVAVEKEHKLMIDLLLERGLTINTPGGEGQTPLMCASTVSMAEFLLSKRASTNVRNLKGESVLYVAAQQGRAEVVKFFLSRNIVPRNELGDTDLHIAAAFGQDEIVKFLLDQGMPISIRGMHGRTAFMATNSVKTASLLFDQEALIATDDDDNSVWHVVAEKGSEEMAKFLVSKGKVDTRLGQRGNTVLHIAAGRGHEGFVKFLLEQGIDVNIPANDGSTPFMHSANKCIATILMARGALINVKTAHGALAIHIAAKLAHDSFLRFLLESTSVDVPDDDGRTPFMYAADEIIAKTLLARGASRTTIAARGFKAIHVAAEFGHERFVKFLLEQGISVDDTTADGRTALHIALHKGHKSLAEFLLTKARFEESHFVTAVDGQHIEIVEMLLHHKGAGTITNTVMIKAKQSGNVEVIRLLESRAPALTSIIPLQSIVPKLSQAMAKLCTIPDTGVAVRAIASGIENAFMDPLGARETIRALTTAMGDLSHKSNIPPDVLITLTEAIASLSQVGSSTPISGCQLGMPLSFAPGESGSPKGTTLKAPIAIENWLPYLPLAMDNLLHLRLPSVTTIPANLQAFHTAQELSLGARVVVEKHSEATTFWPVLLRDSLFDHWGGIIFVKSGSGTSLTVIDSDNSNLVNSFVSTWTITPVTKLNTEPQRYNNCGPELIENFAFHINGHRASQEVAPYVHSLLLENALLAEDLPQIPENLRLIGFLSNADPIPITYLPLPTSGRLALIKYGSAHEDLDSFEKQTVNENGFIEYLQHELKGAISTFKTVDFGVDVARASEQPTLGNIKTAAVDVLHMWSMYSGFSAFSVGASIVSAAHSYYEDGVLPALYSFSTSAAYMFLPGIVLAGASPHIALAYTASMTLFTGCHAATNVYSFFYSSEANSPTRELHSYVAYKDFSKWLAEKTGFQAFENKTKEYELKINDIKAEIEHHATETNLLSEQGEFGAKIYQHIYAPVITAKHDLQQSVIEGLIPQEAADQALNTQLVSIKDTSYNLCRSETDQDYYCSHKEQEIHHIKIVGSTLQVIEIL